MNKKIIIMIMAILFTIVAVQGINFKYKVYVDETLKENQEYSCNYVTDGKSRSFSEDHKGSKIEVIGSSIKDKFSLNCTTNINRITFQLFNDDVLLKQDIYSNKPGLEYELVYHKLKINIESKNNTCTLNQNGITKEYDISNDKRIKEDFFNTFSFSCVNEVDYMELTVSNNDNQGIYYNSYQNVQAITYDSVKSISKDYLVEVYFKDNLTKNNKCTLLLDGKIKVTKTFTKDLKRKYLVMYSKV